MNSAKKYYIEVFKDLWKWLSENPDKNKEDWPRFEINGGDIKFFYNFCPLCHYVYTKYGYVDKCYIVCPIIWDEENITWCHSKGAPYFLWVHAKDNIEKKKYSEIIFNLKENTKE